jgi:hypothetical protein
MLHVMIRHAGHTPGLAADDTAQVELRSFARERKTALLLQASAAVGGLLVQPKATAGVWRRESRESTPAGTSHHMSAASATYRSCLPPSVPVSHAHVITRPRVTCAALLPGRWRHQAHVDYVESQAVDSLH